MSCALVTGVQTCALPISRANDDLGTLKSALDARRADFLNLGHFGKQPVADIFELLRVVAAGRDRDVPAAPATAAMLRLEVDASIGNRSQPRRAIPFELGGGELAVLAQFQIHCRCADIDPRQGGLDERSEEHTSELQSLMRISYAVFCLKKKKKQQSIKHK